MPRSRSRCIGPVIRLLMQRLLFEGEQVWLMANLFNVEILTDASERSKPSSNRLCRKSSCEPVEQGFRFNYYRSNYSGISKNTMAEDSNLLPVIANDLASLSIDTPEDDEKRKNR